MAKIKKYVKKILEILSLEEIKLLPASIAYNFFLALIPLITIIVIIASFFSISIDSIINLLNEILPSSASSYIVNVINGKNFDLSLGVLNFATFMVASNGTYSVIKASNSLYKVHNDDAVKNRIKSVIMLFIIVALLLFLLIVPILGEKIIEVLSSYKTLENIMDKIYIVYKMLKWPITFLIIYFNIKLIYTIAPSVKIDSESTSVGAFCTTVGWILFSLIFSYYVNKFAKYDLLYGSLSGLMVLLMWIYFLSFILILGIIINTKVYNKN